MNTNIRSQLIILVNIITLIYAQRECCEDYCFSADSEKQQAAYFATKTAYEISKEKNSNNQYIVPNCKPTKIWLLSRYGTSLPSTTKINELRELAYLRDEIVSNYENRHGRPDTGGLCPGDVQLIKNWNWNPNLTAQYDSFLATQGWNDMKYLAKYYQSIFPDMFQQQYDQNNYLFRFAKSQRTEGSFRGFADGLFGENAYQRVHFQPPVDQNDTFLRPGEICPNWKSQKANIHQPDSEYSKFKQTPVYQKLISDVSTRLGFKFAIEANKVESMWDMCRYEQAWSLANPSAWCIALTQSQVFTLEYQEDLYNYYKNGYGSKVNEKLACSAVSDMLHHLDSDHSPNIIASFTQSSTLQLFLTTMGFYRDPQPLRADNFDELRQRKWRTSVIDPYGGNIAVTKYYCPNEEEKHKIIFFSNQRPIMLDWCRVGLCDWSAVKQKYMEYMNADCSKITCGINSANLLRISMAGLLATALLTISLHIYGPIIN